MFKRCRKNNEAGNILFLILLAVILFAALSYAVTQSLRGGGTGASNERGLIKSTVLTSYPTALRAAIMRMVVTGTSPLNLNFDPPSVFSNANYTTAEQLLGVFHANGGGATFTFVPSDALATASSTARWYFNSTFEVPQIGLSNTSSTDGNDLIAFAPGLDSTLCAKINFDLGAATSATAAPPILSATPATALDLSSVTSSMMQTVQDDVAATDRGSAYASGDGVTLTDGGTGLDNRPALCIQDGASGSYVFYSVLSER